MRATGVSRSTSSWMVAPLLVRPGHMMFAPWKTNLMAPLSTRRRGIIIGSAGGGRWGGGDAGGAARSLSGGM